MVSGNEHSVYESVEENDNSSCEVENNDKDYSIASDVKGKGSDISGLANSPSVEITPGVSPSPSSTKKGFGLKKWKRIKRDVTKGGDSRADSGKIVIEDSSELIVNPSKRPQVYAERLQKSEGSVSSVNAQVGSLDFLGVLGDSCTSVGLSIDAGADSENSEDQSSKSSTATSVPKVKYDKSRMKSLGGNKFTHTVQRGQPGKVRNEATKKAREEQQGVIKEENYRSSMESDSHSSNFVFMLGTYASSNGIQCDGPGHYDGENDNEVKGSEQEVDDGVSDSYRKDDEGGYEDILAEDGSADSYRKVKTERNENSSSSNEDLLVKSIIALQSAEEALEKEVLKFKEININVSVDDLVSDAHPEVTAVEQKVGELFPFGVGIERVKEHAETELEDLFKRKIAAQVEYLTISRTIQNLRADAAVNQTTNLEKQNTPTSEEDQIVKNHIDTEKEGSVLKAKAEKLEKIHEDLASEDEIMKLQKRLCKYTSYFFIQLLCVLVILRFLLSKLSPDPVEVIPT